VEGAEEDNREGAVGGKGKRGEKQWARMEWGNPPSKALPDSSGK